MGRVLSIALVMLVSLGLAYAVATVAAKSISDSLNRSAELIDHPSAARQ